LKLSLFNKIEFVCGAEVLRLRTRQGGNRNRRSLRSSPLTPSQRTPMLQVYCVGWENDRETKATLHNSAACLAMSFPPSAACKFLDLLPVNLRNLHLHLTKNPFVSQPPHLCGVTLTIKLPIKSKKHGCAARRVGGGERKAPSSPPQRRNPLQHQRHYRTIRRQRWRCLFCHLLLAEISIYLQ